MSAAKAPGPETRPGRLDQVVNMLANRDAGSSASGEDAQKASHRRRKAQIPHRVIKTTERSRTTGAIPVDSESDTDDDYSAETAVRSDEPMDQSGSRLNGHASDNGCSSQEVDGSLPEGTLVLQPEAAKDNSPYVGPEFGTTKSRLQVPATQGADHILNRTYKCTACSQQICSLTAATVKKHPLLGVLLCQSCHNFYASGEFDRDENGYDEQCRWCGQGGNLICCDFCKHSFCKSCIRKNLGRDHLLQVLDAEKWKCLCCDPKPLAFLMQECAGLAACITPAGAGGGGSSGAASHAGGSDAQSRRPSRRSVKPAAVAASNPPSAGAKAPATTGTSASTADSRKTASSVGKPSGSVAVAGATNSRASESSKQPTTGSHRTQSASSKPATTAGRGGTAASASSGTAGRAILQQAATAAAGALTARRGPSGSAASSSPSDAPIIVPLGIVPRAAIRGSRTTFPELVHHLTDSMMERIKKKLAGLCPSSDVKLLVEEVSPDELNAPVSVRRRRLYEVPWERLGFPSPPPEPLRAPAAMTTSGHAVPGPAAGATAVAAPVASTGTAAAAAVASSATAKVQLPAATGRLAHAVQRPSPLVTGGSLVVQRTSSFLGQQPAYDSMSIAEIINKLKRREIIDLESTTNRFLHTLEQTKVNFTDLRKEVHAIKQAKIRQNQEASTKRSSHQPHLEAEVALHARIRAALLDHLQVVYQICLSSTKLVGEVSVPAATVATPPPPPAPADDDASTDEYIDLTDYEKQQKKQPAGGSIGRAALTSSSVTNAAAASPIAGSTSQPSIQTKSALPSPDASAVGGRSAAKRGGTAAAVMAPTSKTKRQQQAEEPSEARSGEHVLVVDSDSNGGETAQELAASQTAIASAYDTDGSKSEASCSSRRSNAKEQKQKGKPGQAASSKHGVRSKPAGTRRSAGSTPGDDDVDAGDDSKGKTSLDAADDPMLPGGERLSHASHGSGKNAMPSPSGEQPLGANDQARLELLGDLCSLSDGESDNDEDDDNDEDYLVSLTKSKQRLTSSKRSQSAANRDVRIAVKQQVRAEAGSGAEPSVLKPFDAAYVKLKLLNPLEIQSLRAELKLQSMSRASQARQVRDHPSDEIASRAEKELRSLSQLVVRVKHEPSSDDEVQHGQDEGTTSFGDDSQTEAGRKEGATAGGSANDCQPKGVDKSSKKRQAANVLDGTGSEPSSDDAEDESDDAASDVNDAVATAGEASADAGTGDHDASDSNKAALRSLLNEGLFDSSLEDTGNSDSDEIQRPAKKRPRIMSNEEGGAVSDGESGDSESRASGDAGSSTDASKKATHPLLKQRLPPGVGNSSSNGSGDGSPAASGQGENVVMSDAESALSEKQNLPETSNMTRSTEDTAHRSDDSELGHHRASQEHSGSSSASDDSDDGVCGIGDGGARGTRKRRRLSSSSSGGSRAGVEHVRSYNAPKRRRRAHALDSSDADGSSSGGCSDVDNALSEDEVVATAESVAESSQRRRKIRRLIEADRLREETKAAAKAEEERRQRIRDKQKLYNQFVLDQSSSTACQPLAELVLERGEDGKALVSVDPELLSKLKPHQAEAVQFLWDCVIESIARVKSTGASAAGSGAILAHCMGLGKTFTVITFLHTVLNHESLLSLRTAVVICPLGTISNWASEWEKWQETVDRRIHLFDMSIMKKNVDRAHMLRNWQKDGGVLVLGYEMYRTLVAGKRLKEKSMKETFTSALLNPGPDIIVCDEGHLLKNATTNINKSLVQARTQRRIVLTGTPLQNNLKEYFVMMDLVKPNLLGSSKEFSNRFIQPILNGQCKDSTPSDVKLMKKRAHVLHEMLAGCVQRRDYSALTKYLPPKLEYIISVRLSKLQILLYERYLKLREGHIGTNASTNTLFADYQWLLKIWTHPWLLRLDRRRREAHSDSFIDDETTSEESLDDEDDDDVLVQDSSDDAADVTWKPFRKKKNEKKNRSDPMKDVEVIDVDADLPVRPEITGVDPDWWQFMVPADLEKQFELSGKLILLFEILRLSEEIGDKVLVFSQSLLTLDYIEDALETIDEAVQSPTGNAKLKTIAGTGRFLRDVNYFRLDGSVNVHIRTRACEKFNDPNNLDARLFLISTRAGGLGINLSSANRVVILDASWNPSQDVQAIFRAYRFGQTKPCYVYRLLSQGSMEERIYERQVTKLSLSERVVDERQIERHFLASDLSELYKFTPYQPDDPNAKPKETPVLPKDRVLAELLEGQATWIVSYHEHDSLLEDLPSEQLTEEERKIAWDEYKAEKERGYVVAAAASISAATAGPSAAPAVGRSQLAGGTGPGSWPPKTSRDIDDVTKAIRLRLQSQGLTDEDELRKRADSILHMAILATYPRAEQMRQLAQVSGVSSGGGGGMAQQAQQVAMLRQQANMPAGAKAGTRFPGPQWPQHTDAGQFRGIPYGGPQQRMAMPLRPRQSPAAAAGSSVQELLPTAQHSFRPGPLMHLNPSTSKGMVPMIAFQPPGSATSASTQGSPSLGPLSFAPTVSSSRLPAGPSLQQPKQMQPAPMTIVTMTNTGEQPHRGIGTVMGRSLGMWPPYAGEATSMASGTGAIVSVAGTAPGAPSRVSSLPQQQYQSLPPNNSSGASLPPK